MLSEHDQKRMEEVADQARRDLLDSVPNAVRALTELVEMADSEVVRRQAALDVLGISGITTKQVVEVDHTLRRGKDEVDHELDKVLQQLADARKPNALVEGMKGELGMGEAPIDVPSHEVEEAMALVSEYENGSAHTGPVPSSPDHETPSWPGTAINHVIPHPVTPGVTPPATA